METQEFQHCDDAGRVVQRGRLVGGELDGELVQLDPAGAVVATMSYKRGKLDGESLFYDGGKLRLRLLYRDGQLQGEPLLYGDDGKPLSK